MGTVHKRQRPKPSFRPDLPIRVAPFERTEQLKALADELAAAEREKATEALQALEQLARQVVASRRQQARQSRPANNATLRAVAALAHTLASQIQALPAEAADLLKARLPAELDKPRRGLDGLEIAKEWIHLCADGARDANGIPAAYARRDGLHFQRVQCLDLLAEAADEFLRKLTCLNVQCAFELVVSEQDLPAPAGDGKDQIVTLLEQLEWLEAAARAAYKRNVRQRGPKSDTVTYRAVEELISMYEVTTEQKATHSASRWICGYTGLPLSDAGRFVAAAMDIIDPALRQRVVADALEHLLWPSRQNSRDSRVG